MTTFEAVILAIVEGLTEFLPVSSTGHMILAQGILHIQNSDFAKTFLINIQFGAILAVLVMYFKRFFQTLEFYKSLFIYQFALKVHVHKKYFFRLWSIKLTTNLASRYNGTSIQRHPVQFDITAPQ